MRGVSIDWTTLEMAFESHAPDVASYLDRETGEIVGVARGAEPALVERIASQPQRFVAIEAVPSREQYRMMERFIETVTHPPLKERLTDSIVGRGAFRRFKDIVGRFPEERKRWFAFRDALLHRHILDWIKVHHIELLEMPAWNLELPSTPSSEPVEEAPETPAEEAERTEQETLRGYLLAWARAHGEEHQYLFGPLAFERLASDMAQEFVLYRRRS